MVDAISLRFGRLGRVSTILMGTLTVMASILLVSCRGESDQPVLTRPAPLGFAPLKVDLQTVGSAMSEGERIALADGILTFEEYESSVLATVACLRTAGYNVTDWPSPGQQQRPEDGPVLSSRGQYRYLADTRGEEGEAVAAKLEECRKNSRVVEPLWSQHVAPTEKDRQQARDAIARCLAETGIRVPEHPSAAELLRVGFPPDGVITMNPPEPYRGCALRAALEHDIPGPYSYYGQ